MIRSAACAAAVAVVAGFAAGCGGGNGVKALSQKFCGPLEYRGPGKPDLLIVSDLPLRNPPPAREQVQGIQYVLRQRHYRAGKYRIGYQSCDDSSASGGGFDPDRCSANAKTYAANERVVGVIGPYNSPCAALQIPVTEAAPDGPLVMIGTATTDPQLTTRVPGGDPGTPRKYYPKGVRNFVRLAAPDQYQAAASAILAGQLRLRRVFVLDDGEGFGVQMGRWFAGMAARRGAHVIGTASWNPKAADYSGLARKVRGAEPDGVYLAGFAFLHGRNVLTALKKALSGKRVAFLAPDGFADEHEVGPVGEGMYVTWAGVPLDRAGPAGKSVLEQTGPDAPIFGYGALYGAAAASVLLDAIEHSNGSRASVTRAVFAATTPPGVIGRFGFDRDGDPTVGAMTIVRMQKGRYRETTTLYPTVGLAKGV
ncbi:MAG TPA: branched-chain amino acid ABC transporter substrate-binding protein [Gaiellaceae bacterium]|nr:branched-chain amino acid ABC transporter substrate-binding protein [Gaiellaceae bacterium]